MYYVLLLIGVSAGIYWLLNGRSLFSLLRNIFYYLAPSKKSKAQNRIDNSAIIPPCIPNENHLGNAGRENITEQISQTKFTVNVAGKESIPVIDCVQIKQNIITGLHQRKHLQRLQNAADEAKPDEAVKKLPVLDENLVRERVRDIHRKNSEQTQEPVNALPILLLRPTLVSKTKNPIQINQPQAKDAFMSSESKLSPESIPAIDLPNHNVVGFAEETTAMLKPDDAQKDEERNGLAYLSIEEITQIEPTQPSSQPAFLSLGSIEDNSRIIETPEASQKPIAELLSQQKIRIDYGVFRVPALSLLHAPDISTETYSAEYLSSQGRLIEEKLAEFKVSVKVAEAYAGPVITRYEIDPAVGVRGNQIVNLSKDLARSLGVVSMRVVETIPGKTCMGLELPNPTRKMIHLSEILSADNFLSSTSRLTMALGQDIIGHPVVMDLAKAPHLLVAGTTGSGKSVGVNAMILSLLYKATPDEVRLIMIDPKMLELSVYNDIPHLLAPVVTDMKLAAHALAWCVNEMERRYRLMSALGVRNLAGFNQKIYEASAQKRSIANPFSLTPDKPEPLIHLPFIVVIVDEFADLMMVAGKKIEELIARLAQKARAAGIHLILATQRPSVDVITGLIKANIPTRIAFQVSSKVDSRTILDQMGAESLLGQGDMLFLPPGTGYPLRVHGAFVADEEVHRVAEHLKQQGEPDYTAELLQNSLAEADAASSTRNRSSEDDPLYDEAVSIVLKTRKASISAVQRQLRIGYNRAARLIETMEEAGLVSAMENNGNRTVLAPVSD